MYIDLPAKGCMITMAPGGSNDQSLTQFSEMLRAEGFNAIRESLETGMKKGHIRADTDCRAWARFVTCSLYGMSTQARDGASQSELLSLVDIAVHALEGLRLRAQ